MICYLKSKTHVNSIMSMEGTAKSIVLFSSNLFQAPTSSNKREREFRMCVSPRPEEPKPHFRGSYET